MCTLIARWGYISHGIDTVPASAHVGTARGFCFCSCFIPCFVKGGGTKDERGAREPLSASDGRRIHELIRKGGDCF